MIKNRTLLRFIKLHSMKRRIELSKSDANEILVHNLKLTAGDSVPQIIINKADSISGVDIKFSVGVDSFIRESRSWYHANFNNATN